MATAPGMTSTGLGLLSDDGKRYEMSEGGGAVRSRGVSEDEQFTMEGIQMDKIDIDPDLERQLQAAKEDEPVEAVLLLRNSRAKDKPPIDVEALMKRVREKGDDAGFEMNYMPRVGALIVRARSQLIRLLISQPEVEMASANRIEGDTGL